MNYGNYYFAFNPSIDTEKDQYVRNMRLLNTVYDVLMNDVPVLDAIQRTPYGDILPSSTALAGAAVELIGLEEGGLCQQCGDGCHFPNCTFGRY